MSNPRDHLTHGEIETLDTRILPTARRWLRENPDLTSHAIKTLHFWGEPLVDDHGQPYNPEAKRKERDKRLFDINDILTNTVQQNEQP